LEEITTFFVMISPRA